MQQNKFAGSSRLITCLFDASYVFSASDCESERAQFARGVPSHYPPAEAGYDVTALAAFVEKALTECNESLDPATWQPVVTQLASILNRATAASATAQAAAAAAASELAAAQRQIEHERRRADDATAAVCILSVVLSVHCYQNRG
jgi:hypothetical protein